MKNITPTKETQGFIEFIDKYFRGKLRGFSTAFKIPHTNLYNNLKLGRLSLTDSMFKEIGEKYPEVDINYIQTGAGSGKLLKYKTNDEVHTTNDAGGDEDDVVTLSTIKNLVTKAISSKDEVIQVQRILIKRTEEMAYSKDEIIKRDAEIKKVLYEFNSYLQSSASSK
jgi:hypothetical protein